MCRHHLTASIPVAFLPRHGRGHRFNPTHIPARANIYALKTLGVERIISISAVGSLKEEFAPMDLVIPSQLIDRTRQRDNTFYDQDMVVHVGFAEPFCPDASRSLHHAAQEMDLNVHPGGTMVVMEGPAFSTKAESFMYRSWGADIIGMPALPEAKLAREAEICYAGLSLVTDYDTWRESSEPVTGEMIIQNLTRNVDMAKRIVAEAVRGLPAARACSCGSALANALVTAPALVPDDVKRDLAPIIERYMPVGATA